MPGVAFSPRMRLSIELALSGEGGDADRLAEQNDAAARLGMTGAEIDAARHGRSFDVLTSRLLALVLATRAADRDRQAEARRRARGAGVPDAVCREVEAMAALAIGRPATE